MQGSQVKNRNRRQHHNIRQPPMMRVMWIIPLRHPAEPVEPKAQEYRVRNNYFIPLLLLPSSNASVSHEVDILCHLWGPKRQLVTRLPGELVCLNV